MRKPAATEVSLAVTLPLAATSTEAQDHGRVDARIELTRSVIQTERQPIIAADLALTPAASEALWALCRESRGELERVGDRTVKLLTDDSARQLLDESSAIERERLKLATRVTGKLGHVPAELRRRRPVASSSRASSLRRSTTTSPTRSLS